MAASQTDICNRALQRLGAQRIQSINDQSPAARACLTCYYPVRDAVLRSHRWGFAIQRFQLAASSTPPVFGPANYFPLPTGWLKVLSPDAKMNWNFRDWIIESNQIVSDMSAPLSVRIVMSIEDTTKYDPCFVEAFAARMAWEMCEQVTQSNTKKADCKTAFDLAIGEAKKANAIEQVPQRPEEDEWVTARLTSGSSVTGYGLWWGL